MIVRTTRPTCHFRRDFKREKMTPRGHRLDALVATVTAMLAADMPLSDRRHDHPLGGSFDDFRDCHVHTELVLIYRKPDVYTLELVLLVHDIFRLMIARNAKGRAVPFEPLVPGLTTVAAINEARGGGLTGFANSKALLKWLNADD
jgi:mRNA interferase YafQ